MPENHATDTATPVDIVQSFYAAINQRDAAAMEAIIAQSFAEEATVEFPSSLPYGGLLQGAPTLRKVFAGMAGGKSSVGPRALTVEAIVYHDDLAVAVLGFDWYPTGSGDSVPSGACETWRFEDGKVIEIRAYYWDTATLVAALPRPN